MGAGGWTSAGKNLLRRTLERKSEQRWTPRCFFSSLPLRQGCLPPGVGCQLLMAHSHIPHWDSLSAAGNCPAQACIPSQRVALSHFPSDVGRQSPRPLASIWANSSRQLPQACLRPQLQTHGGQLFPPPALLSSLPRGCTS